MTRYIGAHTIDNGGIQMAVLRAANAGMTAMQLFTAIPKFYGDKSTIKPERVTRFKTALAKTKINPGPPSAALRRGTTPLLQAAQSATFSTVSGTTRRRASRWSRCRW